jgi:hypothetical protein
MEVLNCICGRVLPANLVVLPMFSYDIILGMDWLTKHSVIIDCVLKQVTLKEESNVRWNASEIFTSNNFGRVGKEAYRQRRSGVFGIHCHSIEASKEESGRYSCGV